MQGKLSCPFQKQCGVFCLPCVLLNLQQLSSAVPAHCKLQARSRSCSAAGMMKMLRRIPSSQYSGFSPPGPASRPALCWGPCGVESGFYKVAVACLFTFTGCLHGCRFTHLLYHNFELFSCCACLGMRLYKAETSLVAGGGWVGGLGVTLTA